MSMIQNIYQQQLYSKYTKDKQQKTKKLDVALNNLASISSYNLRTSFKRKHSTFSTSFDKVLSQEQVTLLFEHMMNRAKLVFVHISSFHAYFCSFCKIKEPNLQREMYLMQKGRRKLMRKLDIMRLLGKMQNFEILERVLFSRDQRILLHFQKQSMIASSTTSSSSNQEFDVDQIAFNAFI